MHPVMPSDTASNRLFHNIPLTHSLPNMPSPHVPGIALLLWAINHFTYSHYYHVRVKKGKLLWQHGFIEPFTFAVSSAIIGTQGIKPSSRLYSLFGLTNLESPSNIPAISPLLILPLTYILQLSSWITSNTHYNKLTPSHSLPQFTLSFICFLIAVLQSKCMSMLIQVSSRGIVNEFTRPHIWWILGKASLRWRHSYNFYQPLILAVKPSSHPIYYTLPNTPLYPS